MADNSRVSESNIRVFPSHKSQHSARNQKEQHEDQSDSNSDNEIPTSQQAGLWDDVAVERHPEEHRLLAFYRGLSYDGNDSSVGA